MKFPVLIAALACTLRAGVLQGIVIENLTGKPLARSVVRLDSLRSGAVYPIATSLSDTAGRFSFTGLPAGAYVVRASREGFSSGTYGGSRAGSPILLNPGARFFAEVRLRRAGAITGEILDENEVGLPGTHVIAYRSDTRPLRPAGSGNSNDRGQFRIPGLEPGRYFVRTAPRLLADNRGMLPTFYGQTVNAQAARSVSVEAETDSGGVTIQPLSGNLARISGRVGGQATTVVLFSDTGSQTVAPAADGSFAFGDLAPGPHEILAQAAGRVAWRRLNVAEGTNQVGLELGPMPSVRVRVDGAGGDVRVLLTRAGVSAGMPPPPAIRSEPAEVTPGLYSVTATVNDPMKYVASVRPSDLTLTAGESAEVTVTVSGDAASISGMVRLPGGGEPAAAAPIFLYAADPDVRARVGGVRMGVAGKDGKYAVRGLPPGVYLIFSALGIGEPDQADPRDWPFLTVTVKPGEEAMADLELAPAR